MTSASRRLALARWSGARIPIPTHTVTADDVTRGKPDPEPFVTGASRLGVDIADCLVFEDSESGARAGLSAGARVIAVGDIPWSFEPLARVPDLSFATVLPTGHNESGLTIRIALTEDQRQ